jgi:hypothetical protein
MIFLRHCEEGDSPTKQSRVKLEIASGKEQERPRNDGMEKEFYYAKET